LEPRKSIKKKKQAQSAKSAKKGPAKKGKKNIETPNREKKKVKAKRMEKKSPTTLRGNRVRRKNNQGRAQAALWDKTSWKTKRVR